MRKAIIEAKAEWLAGHPLPKAKNVVWAWMQLIGVVAWQISIAASVAAGFGYMVARMKPISPACDWRAQTIQLCN
jgi:hypothetical protein